MQKRIIQLLKKAPGYLSGEEISRSFSISRAAIWKYMQDLREWGYDIAAVPHLGYRLVSCPDRLFPWEIQSDLGTRVFGRHVVYRETVFSTMDEAFQLGMGPAAEGTVVCAEGQTKGRGRMGRHWVSPKGKGIYLSILLRPALPPAEVAKLTLLAAVAVSEAVRNVAGVSVQIKWPNDILVNGRKLAGILTELNAEVDRVKFVVVGIGLNVNTPRHHLPDNATSLKQETERSVSRVALTQEILRSFEKWYGVLKAEGFAPVLQQWKEHTVTFGRRVAISDPRGDIEGYALDLAEDGGLIIRKDSGEVVKKMSGDVINVL